ncbi:hypothetical protein CR513_33174, partial [Mucuna pruriens]
MSKLLPQRVGPFLVLKLINGNAYVLDMPEEFDGSCTFNVLDLSLFDVESYLNQGNQDDSQRNLVGTTRESLPRPLARCRLKKLEAKVQRNKDLLKGKEESKARSTLFTLSNPPLFKGVYVLDRAQNWIKEVNKIFHAIERRKSQNFDTYVLVVEAKYWWENIHVSMEAKGCSITLENFKGAFLEKYLLEDVRNKK